MRNLKTVVLGTVAGFILMGCGGGKGVIRNVVFSSTTVGSDVTLQLDATMASGGLVLPSATLPLYNPNNPSQLLGEIQTNGAHIIVEVNATQALQLPVLADGTKLPNGAALPLTLPAGLNPIAIPVFNSNSMVYLAVTGQQVMLGVAVSILKQDALNLPLSLFLPFTISPEIRGTGGFFLGDKQGVAVFAIREPLAPPKTFAAKTAGAVTAMSSLTSMAAVLAPVGRIEVKEEALTRSKIRRLQNARSSLGDIRLD